MNTDLYLFRVTASDQNELTTQLQNAKLHHPVCFKQNNFKTTFLYQDESSLQKQLVAHLDKTQKLKAEPICFLYTGQGSQYPGMGKTLYKTVPIIKKKLDQYQDILYGFNGKNYLNCLLSDNETIHQTSHTQPCMVMLQLALSHLWEAMHITPSIVIGHSVGEFSASVQKSHLNEEQCLKLIAKRAECMQDLKIEGGMIAIRATANQVQSMLETHNIDIDYAAWNAPKQVVLSGTELAIVKVKNACTIEKMRSTELQVSHPFHSRLMSPMLDEFCAFAKTIPAQEGNQNILLIRNTTGNTVTTPPCETYWSEHILQPVRFRQSVELVEKMNIGTYLEVGPDHTLSRLASRCFSEDHSPKLLSSMRKNTCPITSIIQSAIALENEGHDINWEPLAHIFSERGKITPEITI